MGIIHKIDENYALLKIIHDDSKCHSRNHIELAAALLDKIPPRFNGKNGIKKKPIIVRVHTEEKAKYDYRKIYSDGELSSFL